MPSAANVKVDKPATSETTPATDSSGNAAAGSGTPIRQAITMLEHKIRNLEKRKAKLESYRDLQTSGKELNQDQKTAVAKYDVVVQSLEFARDLCKQFLGIAAVSEKEAKKQARKEAAARSQAELSKIREVLLVQDALNQMGQETIRDDFLVGRNGAANLTESDLKLLDDFYPIVTPKHEPGDPVAFTNQVQAAAEHLLAVVDGKQKEIIGSTYNQIKEVIGKIHESGYLDQALVVSCEETVAVVEERNCVPLAIPEQQQPPQMMQQIEQPIEPINMEPPRAMIQPVEQAPMEQPLPPEPMYFQPPPPRPITEMLGTGSFFFLQDSELDTPETVAVPSQTFTNTSFVQGPPPPIPLPPKFQNFPPPNNMMNVNQVAAPGNGVEEPPQQFQPPPQLDEPQKQVQQHRGGPPLRHNNNANQNYYHNNGGFANRPRQNRNGPKTGHRPNQ